MHVELEEERAEPPEKPRAWDPIQGALLRVLQPKHEGTVQRVVGSSNALCEDELAGDRYAAL